MESLKIKTVTILTLALFSGTSACDAIQKNGTPAGISVTIHWEGFDPASEGSIFNRYNGTQGATVLIVTPKSVHKYKTTFEVLNYNTRCAWITSASAEIPGVAELNFGSSRVHSCSGGGDYSTLKLNPSF